MIRRVRFNKKNNTAGMNDMNQDDCYASAYYLYCISELLYQSSDEISDFDDHGSLYIPHIRLFLNLAKHMEKLDDISKFLVKTVDKAEEKGILTRLSQNENTENEDENSRTHRLARYSRDIYFDDSDIPYEYTEDHSIDRNLPSREFKITPLIINLYRCLFAMEDSYNFFARLIANFLLLKEETPNFSMLETVPSYVKRALNNNRKVAFLEKALNLTKKESKFLLFLYRCAISQPILISDISAEIKSQFLKTALDITASEYNGLLRSSGALRSFGFIDDNGAIQDDTIDCIANKDLNVFFSDLVKEADCSGAYKLSSYNVNKNASMIMQKMLSGSENISLLLYGKPGSGKTEYAKSLAAASGLKPFIFKNEAELTRTPKNAAGDNVLCRLNLFLSINRPDTVLIIDEADTLLQTRDASFFGITAPSKTKGTINKMLEKGKNKIIWIVNFTNQIDDSTLRRFNFSYKFDSMSREQLRSITTNKLNPLHLPSKTNTEILNLMEKFSVTGASVDNVVKTIKSIREEVSEESEPFLGCIKTILKENSLLINGKSKMRETVSKSYDTRALNASMDPEKIVRMIRNAQRFSEENQRGAHASENGIRMLFYGLSGTGKTEFARYIAEKLNKKILLKRASDILDKYVGGSEQNIRKAFEEADRTGSILLFDEADSFFADRNGAEHNWERTQVNEFLTQMEEFGGILICTTNLKKIMDSAMNRRFHMIVEFKPLTADGIRCMLDRYFHSFSFSDEEIHRLECRSSITPGDFGVLASRMRFMDKESLNTAYIIDELCAIQDDKNDNGSSNKIGFAM